MQPADRREDAGRRFRATPTENLGESRTFRFSLRASLRSFACGVGRLIHDADQKGLAEISTEMKELALRGKDNKLLPHEYTGGSITISNLGMFGITEFQAIINPPQSSIIAVGSIVEKPVVNAGAIQVGHTMKSTISADHRSLDGAVAAKLLKDFSDILEDPFQIWLNSLDMEVI